MPTTFTTAAYDEQKLNRANTSREAAANVVSGALEFASVSHTLDGDEATGGFISLCLLPAGAIPVPEFSIVVCSADPVDDTVEPEETGELIIDIGTADNADGWADGIDLSAGGPINATSGTIPAWLTPTPIVADNAAAGVGSGTARVYATLASVAGEIQAGVVLHFLLAFKRGR